MIVTPLRRPDSGPRPLVARLAPTPPDPGSVPVGSVQGSLALDVLPAAPLPPAVDADLRTGARLPGVDDSRVKEWSARFAQAAVEVCEGHRPLTQLLRWTSPEVYAELQQRRRAGGASTALQRRHALRPHVRSVHVCRPTPVVAEVSVHVRQGQRSRAVAMRLERHGERWLCTTLLLG